VGMVSGTDGGLEGEGDQLEGLQGGAGEEDDAEGG